MPNDDASEGNERMDRDMAKRPERPRPGRLAGRDCKGSPAPRRDSKTPRPTRTGRFRAILGLGLSRLLEFVAAWNRHGRDRKYLAELNEFRLRDIGIDSTTAERDTMSYLRVSLGLGPGFSADWRRAVRRDGEYRQP